ncbi:Metallo-beta-lactamase superfamily protein [Mycena indigotica]|uniref:Metallo-beta-lactamase superfamily protein n=1 Tax=Mycena indigotica TaxID=2126181 RepID=A0A8H6SUJ8_9AGAR|nr:Metallo-beta-lactamase superfamily protein [Mycena indigotica]KAF7304195.1 Metallo-beta-lactamase superfamily protein [Mycena indigotica]
MSRTLLLPLLFAGASLASWQSLGIPTSRTGATLSVKAFNIGNLTIGGTATVVHPVLPGRETTTVPMFGFLLERTIGTGPSAKTYQYVWDLGIRKDPENAVPPVAELFKAFPGALDEPKDITELLVAGGVKLESIEQVFWSHAHLDHIGDMSKFPNSTGLVIGAATNTTPYPANPASQLQPSDFAGHTLSKVDFTTSKLLINNLRAVDYFNDGSFYLLDTPGHIAGHMTGLARVSTSPPSFVLLAGDTAHQIGAVRPRPLLQKHFPCPAHVLADARAHVSTDFFWSSGSKLGQFDLLTRSEQMLDLADVPGGLYADQPTAVVSLDKVALFDADPDVFVVIAHDVSLLGAMPVFPQTLNGWKKGGLKERTVWRFLQPDNPAFIFSPV